MAQRGLPEAHRREDGAVEIGQPLQTEGHLAPFVGHDECGGCEAMAAQVEGIGEIGMVKVFRQLHP